MYKNKKYRGAINKSNILRPMPVVLSQRNVIAPKIISADDEICSQDSIPSSQNQNTTQASQSRFLSQRIQIARRTQDQVDRGKNYFEITLFNCKIQKTDVGWVLMLEHDDPISLTRRLRTLLSAHHEYPKNAEKFIREFSEAFSLNGSDEYPKYLSGIFMKEHQQKYQSQTSLIQCFLSIDCLKDEVAKLLLSNLKAYLKERKESADSFTVGLILAQFKFCDQLLSHKTYDFIFEEMFNILSTTESEVCREIIITNFRDLDGFRQDECIKRLLTIYGNSNEILTPAVIETFTEMAINDDTLIELTGKILVYLQNNCPIRLYPAMVKYLLSYSTSPIEVIKIIREQLKWDEDENNESLNNVKKEVFKLMEKSLKQQNSKMFDAWMKVVSGLKSYKNLKHIDFVALLLMLSVQDDKFAVIKKIFITKLPEGFFSSKFLQETFKIFPMAVIENCTGLMELLDALQKNKLQEVHSFSSTCYKLLFEIKFCDKKQLISSLTRFLCEKSPNLPFTTSDFKIITLNILNDVIKNESAAASLLLNYKILLRVLDQQVKLTLSQYRLLMELLCSLAYGTDFIAKRRPIEVQSIKETIAALREHLEMWVKKQMCNPDVKTKQMGIIGTIKIVSQLISNIVTDSDASSNHSFTIEEIPEGQIKDAARMIEFLFTSVNGNPEGFAMICDELSLEFQPKGNCVTLNDTFLIWLSEMLFKKLEVLITVRIDDEIPEIGDIKLVHAFKNPTIEFDDPELSINLGLLVFHEKTQDVIIVPSLFKLTRLLIQHRYNDLSSLYGLCVMPIMLTEHFATSEDVLSDFDEMRAKQLLDLYFHCANWLRELIGAFVHCTPENVLMQSVKKRLKQLVRTEKRLSQLLSSIPSRYHPPTVDFIDAEKQKKVFDAVAKTKVPDETAPAPSKKARKSKKMNDAECQRVVKKKPGKEISPRQFCRQIDSEIILLLKENFKLDRDSTNDDSEFGLTELEFLLADVYGKIESTFMPRTAVTNYTDPIKAIIDLKETLIPYLLKIYNNVCNELMLMNQQADVDDSNSIYYTDDGNMIKSCFSQILRFFSTILSCPKLKMEENTTLLKDVICAFLTDVSSRIDSVDQMTFLILEYFLDQEKYCMNSDSAVELVKLLRVLLNFGENEQQDQVQDLCERFLKREWKNANGINESGSAFNKNLDQLLQGYVDGVDFNSIENKVMLLWKDFQNIITKKLEILENFPSFNRSNAIIMVRIYMTRTSFVLKQISYEKVIPNEIEFWERCAKIFSHLMDIVKCLGLANGFNIYLKNFLIYMRLFNIHGINVLKTIAQSNRIKFSSILKSMQVTTRFAHSVTCDLKHRKNQAIFLLIPNIREVLMKFFQSVCELSISINLPPDAFFTGCLRNYDLNGEEILSQNQTSQNDSDPDDSDSNNNDQEEDQQDDPDSEIEMNISDNRRRSARSRSTIL